MMNPSPVMRFLCRWVARYYLKKPDLSDFLPIKYPRLSDLWPAVLNEASFRLGATRAFRLTGLNVELTHRCNLACRHCPRSEGRRREDMDFHTFRRIVDGVPGLGLLLPFQWGEPLLSPILPQCIAYARRRGIRVMLTTNGTLLDAERSRALLEAGLERLTVSYDGNDETHAALRGVDPEEILRKARAFRVLRDRLGAECRLDASMVVDPATEPFMDDFRRRFEGVADRIQYVPRFVEGRRQTPCRELWRGVLVVLSDGTVTVCCADPAGARAIGDVHRDDLVRLFNGPALRALRGMHRRRTFPGLCRTCAEYTSPRVSPRFA